MITIYDVCTLKDLGNSLKRDIRNFKALRIEKNYLSFWQVTAEYRIEEGLPYHLKNIN